MVKVITYGTYDLLHHGHIRLLERAKTLGDYLIVGVTSDDFDKTRGKINVQQTLEDRVDAIRATGIADKIIIEEYEGQKIDDIKKYGIDIFTVGSDWVGKFDYLKEYCKVVYLARTQGVSSSEIRDKKSLIRIGIVGYASYLNRVFVESKVVNGANVTSLLSNDTSQLHENMLSALEVTDDWQQFLEGVDAVYIHSNPTRHFEECRLAIESGKHVLCESPVAMTREEAQVLIEKSKEKNVVFMESLRTAYSTAYARMLLLIKSGRIGDVVAIDSTCTSLSTNKNASNVEGTWSSMTAWGSTGLLPAFQILGTDYKNISIVSRCHIEKNKDEFSKISVLYDNAVATIKVGTGVKSEGELIISGTKGYVYVPAPWWKMDYFEIRYENPASNKRYFYQLDGEGIRYEWVAFLKMINASAKKDIIGFTDNISRNVTEAIADVMGMFTRGENVDYI